MMMKQDAQRLVYENINEDDPYWPDKPEFVILEDETTEKDYGWVFFYQSRNYLETESFIDSLVGNAPYIVNKHTGELFVTGTAKPVEEYIEEYESKL